MRWSQSCKCFPENNDLKQCTKSDEDCGRWERCYFTDLGPGWHNVTNRLCMACYHIDMDAFKGLIKIEPADNTPATCSKHPYGGLGNGIGTGQGDGSGTGQSRPPDVSATPSYVAPPSITPFPVNAGATESSAPTAQGISEPVCIDAKLLERSGHQGVYKSHRLAEVLCDNMGSCATSGRMVVFKGKTTMMSKYCMIAEGGCRRRVMEVNSPRIGSSVGVKTNTDELQMTALAARYATSAEELMLKALVRLGA